MVIPFFFVPFTIIMPLWMQYHGKTMLLGIYHVNTLELGWNTMVRPCFGTFAMEILYLVSSTCSGYYVIWMHYQYHCKTMLFGIYQANAMFF